MELRDSKFGLFYGCVRFPECKATHGAHRDGRPLGIPATKATKQARIAAHDAFDRIWKEHHMPRRAAYVWMQRAMGLSAEEAHIGRFNLEQCEQLRCAAVEFLKGASCDTKSS
jgi:ssDNA-binding Zn-finger/Zn-ribbon topoisomerase 1